MVCPEYEDLRYNFFTENMLTNVNLNKFYSFMTSKNVHRVYIYYPKPITGSINYV